MATKGNLCFWLHNICSVFAPTSLVVHKEMIEAILPDLALLAVSCGVATVEHLRPPPTPHPSDCPETLFKQANKTTHKTGEEHCDLCADVAIDLAEEAEQCKHDRVLLWGEFFFFCNLNARFLHLNKDLMVASQAWYIHSASFKLIACKSCYHSF